MVPWRRERPGSPIFLEGADCLSTIDCFRSMGVSIEKNEHEVLIHGKGLHGLKAPQTILDCGNSGTTMRLLSGILAAQPFSSELTGDASIRKRPMKRIMTPLSLMGADIESRDGTGCAPLKIRGKTPAGDPLRLSRRLCSGEIRRASGRSLRRWRHQRDRALCIPKSHGTHAPGLRRPHRLGGHNRQRVPRGGTVCPGDFRTGRPFPRPPIS